MGVVECFDERIFCYSSVCSIVPEVIKKILFRSKLCDIKTFGLFAIFCVKYILKKHIYLRIYNVESLFNDIVDVYYVEVKNSKVQNLKKLESSYPDFRSQALWGRAGIGINTE